MKTLVLATRNAGKAREFRVLLEPIGYQVVMASEVGYDGDPEETGDTFRANALIKAQDVASHIAHPVLADDSGLEVTALDGRPGVHSARYAGPKAEDAANRRKLLDAMRSQANRHARFVCVLCFLEPGAKPRFFEAECRGSVAQSERGQNGFGYDSLFVPEGESRTFSEMNPREKNPLSHRGKAVAEFLAFLQTKQRKESVDGDTLSRRDWKS